MFTESEVINFRLQFYNKSLKFQTLTKFPKSLRLIEPAQI